MQFWQLSAAMHTAHAWLPFLPRAGGWGKPPVDEEGNALYGDVFAQLEDNADSDDEVDRGGAWGALEELESEEEEDETEDADEEEEDDGGWMPSHAGRAAGGIGCVKSLSLPPPCRLAAWLPSLPC